MSGVLRVCLALSPQTLLPLILSLKGAAEEVPTYDVAILNTDYAPAIAKTMLDQMRMLTRLHDFAEVHDLSSLLVCQPRTKQSNVGWLIEFIRRHRADAARILSLKREVLGRARKALSREMNLEFWCDEPIHYPTQIIRAGFPEAVTVKYPHGTNLETAGSEARMQVSWVQYETTAKRVRRQAVNLLSGLKLTSRHTFRYDKSVTLNEGTNIAPRCIDASATVSIKHFASLFELCPLEFRREFQTMLSDAMGGKQSIFLLLPFGISPEEDIRQRAEGFAEALEILRPMWEGSALIIKTHPSQSFGPEKVFADNVSRILGVPAKLLAIRSGIPLELILGGLPPCVGALGDPSSSIQTLQRVIGCPTFVLRKSADDMKRKYPEDLVFDEITSKATLV